MRFVFPSSGRALASVIAIAFACALSGCAADSPYCQNFDYVVDSAELCPPQPTKPIKLGRLPISQPARPL